MTSILKISAIVTAFLTIVYTIKNRLKPKKPISYEVILKSAISHIKENGYVNGGYDLIIFPPNKAKEFLSENPDFFDNMSIKDIANKKLVIWFVQQGENVIYQEALLSDSISLDFTDVVPSDKIYKKKIKISE